MKKWLFVVFGVTIISSGVLYVWLGNEMDRGVEKRHLAKMNTPLF